MDTPIFDFVRRYADSKVKRLHMPGHKGQNILGCEKWDITEVCGADALYEADGVIAGSEKNATELFCTQKTVYSTEGSSQCIRAMLYLAIMNRKPNSKPVIVAARNVHKAFVYAAALLDIDVIWIWPENRESLCGCHVSAEQLDLVLAGLKEPPAAVYITSPDYLGAMADVSGLADVCHRHKTILAVDNAHGAYLRFLAPSRHPMDLGADICCDSAHKTLPVLTGGAYLHVGKEAPIELAHQMKQAMALFGSTSPSYLTMISLDMCNARITQGYQEKLTETIHEIENVKKILGERGWIVENSDPLRITIRAPYGTTGVYLSQRLRDQGIECEYSDNDFLVCMLTTDNSREDIMSILSVLGDNDVLQQRDIVLPDTKSVQVVSIRQALFSDHEIISIEDAVGRICAAPMVSCPPAIPIVVSGERIGEETIALFKYYGVKQVDVLKI